MAALLASDTSLQPPHVLIAPTAFSFSLSPLALCSQEKYFVVVSSFHVCCCMERDWVVYDLFGRTVGPGLILTPLQTSSLGGATFALLTSDVTNNYVLII